MREVITGLADCGQFGLQNFRPSCNTRMNVYGKRRGVNLEEGAPTN